MCNTNIFAGVVLGVVFILIGTTFCCYDKYLLQIEKVDSDK